MGSATRRPHSHAHTDANASIHTHIHTHTHGHGHSHTYTAGNEYERCAHADDKADARPIRMANARRCRDV